MASEKIINKILEGAEEECNQILTNARDRAKQDTEQIEKETDEKLEKLDTQLRNDMDTTKERLRLNTHLDERKDLLRVKREVMDEAFDLAREKLANLPLKTWRPFVYQIILDAVATDTEYLKVPKKDIKRYTEKIEGNMTFLDVINQGLSEAGHKKELVLDRDPAHFKDGIMLIGEYSDVNASFDVLLENMREYLEWDVTQILFGSDEDE